MLNSVVVGERTKLNWSRLLAPVLPGTIGCNESTPTGPQRNTFLHTERSRVFKPPVHFPVSSLPVKTLVFCYHSQSILSLPFHLPHEHVYMHKRAHTYTHTHTYTPPHRHTQKKGTNASFMNAGSGAHAHPSAHAPETSSNSLQLYSSPAGRHRQTSGAPVPTYSSFHHHIIDFDELTLDPSDLWPF